MKVSFHGGSEIEIFKIKEKIDKEKYSRDDLVSKISPEKLLCMYKNMVRTRAFDDKIKAMLNRGFSISEHSTLGQEAGPIGACSALEPNDYIMPYHRGLSLIHISEPTRLGMISYAVFCLKKK